MAGVHGTILDAFSGAAGRLTRNWRVKLLALLLALLAWVYAYRGDVTTRELSVAVTLILPEDISLIDAGRDTVTLTVRGSPFILENLREDAVRVRRQVRVRGDVPGVVTRPVAIREADVAGLPSGVSVHGISPERVEITYDRRTRRLLPVRLAVDGEPEKGYRIAGEARLYPNSVWVSGPWSVLDGAAFIETRPVNIRGLAGDRWYEYATVALAWDLVNPDTQRAVPVTTEQTSVRVEVRVSPDYEQKTVSLNVLALAPPDFPYTLELLEKKVDVSLKAPQGVMTPEALGKVTAFVDVRSFEPKGPVKADVRFVLPDGIMVDQQGETQVTVDKIIPR